MGSKKSNKNKQSTTNTQTTNTKADNRIAEAGAIQADGNVSVINNTTDGGAIREMGETAKSAISSVSKTTENVAEIAFESLDGLADKNLEANSNALDFAEQAGLQAFEIIGDVIDKTNSTVSDALDFSEKTSSLAVESVNLANTNDTVRGEAQVSIIKYVALGALGLGALYFLRRGRG